VKLMFFNLVYHIGLKFFSLDYANQVMLLEEDPES
jgi:hypothetical protein